jgi:hypothetical protein
MCSDGDAIDGAAAEEIDAKRTCVVAHRAAYRSTAATHDDLRSVEPSTIRLKHAALDDRRRSGARDHRSEVGAELRGGTCHCVQDEKTDDAERRRRNDDVADSGAPA